MKRFAFILPLLVSLSATSASLRKAFEALSVYDYFRARKLFTAINSRKPDPYASYGLALIYLRQDNPFHNTDSAVRHIHRGYAAFLHRKTPRTFAGFTVDSVSYAKLADGAIRQFLETTYQAKSIAAFDQFLRLAWLAPMEIRAQVAEDRDRLEFSEIKAINKSEATSGFMRTHPESVLFTEARFYFDQQVYEESTRDRSEASYLAFLRQQRQNSSRNQAFEKLFAMYRNGKNIAGLAAFVSEFPEAPQNAEAWKLLFSLSVKAYSFTELKKFIDQYPAFPLRNSILRELELNKQLLYPYTRSELTGYVNENGHLRIPPQYDAGAPFSQGLAVVHKGDSAFYINKENVNPFGRAYEEAGTFHNGLAPVKLNGSWYLMNRLGQFISAPYEEIGELSDDMYVVKEGGRYGALDNFGQRVIPSRYAKLGDFKNGFAYCSEDEKYGFVSKQGQIFPPRFEWISDFSLAGFAVFKEKNRFGLVSNDGNIALAAGYDQLLKQNDSIYMAVRDDRYGIFSVEGCFALLPVYDYDISLLSATAGDGRYFRLNRKNQQGVADKNGIVLGTLGSFEEVFLPSGNLVRVKKRGKFGFMNLKGEQVLPCIYSEASDFRNGGAIVKVKEEYAVINAAGKEIFFSDSPILRMGKSYYKSGDEAVTLYDSSGTALFTEAVNLQELAPGVFAFEKGGGEIRLLYD